MTKEITIVSEFEDSDDVPITPASSPFKILIRVGGVKNTRTFIELGDLSLRLDGREEQYVFIESLIALIARSMGDEDDLREMVMSFSRDASWNPLVAYMDWEPTDEEKKHFENPL